MKSFEHFGVKVRKYPEYNYHAIWNGANLTTIRLGSGVAKELPPDHSEFYDVSLGTKCNLECPFCYVKASNKGVFYKDIMGQAKKFFGSMSSNQKALQIAIGSESEPTIHPEFLEFLKVIYDLNIVPNYTTNGITIANDDDYSKKLLEYTEKYCAAVAVSCNNFNKSIDKQWRKAIDKLSKIDINITLHIIISDLESVKRFNEIYNEYKDVVRYFVLLPLMPSGRSTEKYSEEAFNEIVNGNYDFNKLAWGANFYESLKTQNKIKLWMYPPESLSKNLILDNPIRITPSSFQCETTLLEIE